jgi:hypothetical protein
LHALIRIVALPEQEIIHAQKRNRELSCLAEAPTIENGLEANQEETAGVV